jgi:hypothetical protein
MRILLDIDGVMVTTPSWKRTEVLDDHFPNFNRTAIDNLLKIINQTNASIVLTTSHKSRFTLSEWKNIFMKRGVSVDSISCLNENTSSLNRKEEILNWAKDEGHQDFVIIDDDRSLNDLPFELKNKCVLTSPLIGLDENAASTAIDILRGSIVRNKNMAMA